MNKLTPPPRALPPFNRVQITPSASDCQCSSASCASESSSAPLNARFSWHISGMDCAACARKVENAVRQVPGVSGVQVVFATEKLLVDGGDDIEQPVIAAIRQAGYSAESLTAPAPAPRSRWREAAPILGLALLMAVSFLLSHLNPTLGQIAFTLSALAGLLPIARQAWRLMRSGSLFSIETLMTVACSGALIIGAAGEAAMVLLLFMVGERLEAVAARRARRGVTALMALQPEVATVVVNGQRITRAAGELRPGEIIEVAAGGRLPADARLLETAASFDESALTGESIPVVRQPGEQIAAGATSVDRLVTLEVISEPGDNAVDRIVRLIEEAESHRAPVERFIDRFSRIYTPVIMLLALLCAVLPPLLLGQSWEAWIYKALTLLLIGCPCALVISTPAAITSGLAAAARHGALIKGGAALEQLSRIRQIAFDKTGTLTEGKPRLLAIHPAAGVDEEQLLSLAAAAEQGSSHPLASALVEAARARGLVLPAAANQLTRAGVGLEASIDGQTIAISAPAALDSAVLNGEWQIQVAKLEAAGQTVVVATRNGELLGILGLLDTLRSDAKAALQRLNELGVHGIMLTGDNPRAAAAIAGELGIDFRASLLPGDKVAAVQALHQQAPLAMVGDGINDAPAMKSATIGIAMGSGSDVALESADAALTHNRLSTLPTMVSLARATRRNIQQNVGLALGLKLLFLVTTLAGLTGLWLAVLADSGATALVTANALRLLRQRAN